MRDPENIDLFEDGAIQSARALSDERRQYIANLVANGIAEVDRSHLETKRLLSLLAEIDDAQIIILAGHLMKNQGNGFYEQHRSIIQPHIVFMSTNDKELDDATIGEAAITHLVRLGLLQPRFRSTKKGEVPEFDRKTGMMKAFGHEVPPLGRLLLRHIGLAEEGDF
jgi:hypothetical protein